MNLLTGQQVRFASTLNNPDDPRFTTRATPLLLPPPGKARLSDELRHFLRVLGAARTRQVMLLNSSWGRLHPDLLAAAVLGLLPRSRRPVVVLAGCMWEPSGGWRGRLEKAVVRLADRAIHRYAVQSTEELSLFPQIWGVASHKTRLCLYYFRLAGRLDPNEPAPPPGRHVFAGGNAHRDYEPLLEAARHFPDRPFILATHRLRGRTDLPANVTAEPVTPEQFLVLTRTAAAVAVPMRRGLRRAAGQQTYLNAMWLGRPTIITNGLGVHDHVRHGQTGLIVDGSTESYVRALQWVFDPAHAAEVTRMSEAAHRVVSQQFTKKNYVGQLLAVLDEAAQEKT